MHLGVVAMSGGVEQVSSSSPTKWLILQGESVLGPFEDMELRSLAKKNVLTPTTMVSVDGDTWRRAKDAISGIFDPRPVASPTRSREEGGENWHLHSHDGKDYGPVSFAELQRWVLDGSVTAGCMLRKEPDSSWHRASEVFPILSSASVQSVSPSVVPNISAARKPKKHETSETEIALAVVGVIVAVVCVAFAVMVLPGIFKAIGPVGVFLTFLFFRFLASAGRR